MEVEFNYFIEQFKEAISRVNQKYIKISIHQLPDNRYRERVYCYELYHQLRNLLGDDYGYMLDGELDKRAHPIIAKYIGSKIPDFVVHYRGIMKHNLIIIEVKPIKSITDNLTNLEYDLDKIIDFIELAEYKYGIMLIYSDGNDNLSHEIKETFRQRTNYYSNKIFLVWHPGPNRPLEILHS